MTGAVPPLPELQFENREFWTGGATGELRIFRCQDCGLWLHPPAPVCRRCLGRSVQAEPVSGVATVVTYTVNHQAWLPGMDVPYVVAIVELVEQPGLRLTTNIVDCDPADVAIGRSVQVVFERREDVWLPLFRPVPSA